MILQHWLSVSFVARLVRGRLPRRRREWRARAERAGSAATLEALETRCLLATITVTSLADDTLANLAGDGFVSLREAIEAANTNASVDGSVAGDAAPIQDAIVFQAGLTGTVMLTAGQLTISETVTITGLSAASTVIDAQMNSRVFDITNTAGDVTLDGLRITCGRTTIDGERGGGIRFLSSTGTLTIANSTVSGNSTTGEDARGGGVYSDFGAVTLTNSAVSGNLTAGNRAYGGGIFSYDGVVTLTKSTASGNSTSGNFANGGGIFSQSGAVTLTNSTVSGNSTARIFADGGGISSIGGAVTLTNSTVSGNSTAGGSSPGGGIFSDYGAVTLTNSTVSGNSTAGDYAMGGGIFSQSGAVTLTNSTVAGNVTEGNTSKGGGISTNDGAVMLTNSTVSGNSTMGDIAFGGGISSILGAVALTNSTVSGNSTAGDFARGGGIYTVFGAVTLTNSTVSGNSTAGDFARGGGIYSPTGAVTLTNSTVSGNSTAGISAPGGGIYSNGGISTNHGAVTIHNSIVAGNTSAGGSPDLLRVFGTLTVRHSLIGDNSGTGLAEAPVGSPDANGNLIGDPTGSGVIDPLLGPLANNGGPTMTHALLAGSPAIDAGDNALAETLGDDGVPGTDDTNEVPLTTDQRGLPFVRIVATVEMGAYELQTVAPLSLVVDTHVDENDGNYGLGDLSLREAIGLANGSLGADSIMFNPALTGLPILLSLGQLTISETVTITGLGAASTVIDAQLNSRVFDITVAAGDVTLDGLTITGGRTTGDNADFLDTTYKGGGIRFQSGGTLTISNGTVSGNSTAGGLAAGSGIYSLSGAVTLTNSTVSGNSTAGPSASGGGIYSRFSAVTLTDSTVAGNSTTGAGGGIFGAFVTLTNSTVSGNSTTGNFGKGGGISCSSVTLTNSTVSGNSTAGHVAFGGGIYSNPGPVTLTNSTVAGNSTTANNSGGGGISNIGGTVTLTNSTVSGNSTAGDFSGGGGIFNNSGAVTLTNSTVSGNSTTGDFSVGGGIYRYSFGAVTLTNSTVSGNSTTGSGSDGGGIYSNDAVTIHNSIVAGNVSPINPDLPFGGTLTVRHSLIGDNSGTGLTEAPVGSPDANGNLIGDPAGMGTIDPRLGPLADNGGPTMTHRLLAGSPAIDAGNNALAETLGNDGLPGTNDANEVALTTDQRGLPFVRIVATVEMGAYELQTVAPLSLVVDTHVDENDGNYGLGDLSLREAIGLANGSLGADSIMFNPALTGLPILLSLGQLTISETVTITGLGATNTVVDAQINSRVFDITASAGDVTLEGVTITRGRPDDGGGGGIRFLSSGTLTISNSTVSGNSTTAFGGGIYSRYGTLTISNSTISGNSTAGNDAKGGGIYSHYGAVTLTNSTVSGNSTTGDYAEGGGISSDDGAVTLTNSTVSGNSTTGDDAEGGGISSDRMILINSTVSGNFTTGNNADGGGISSDGVTLTNSTISGNSTAGDNAGGGGIFNDKDAVTLINSTVTGNRTTGLNSPGGGVYGRVDYYFPVTIHNSIVAGNTSATSHPDLLPGGGGATLTVQSSLVGDNSGTGLTEAPVGFPDIDGNLIGGPTNGVIDPLLGPLADNGGPRMTHRLLLGSPAIDAGNNALAETLGDDGLPGTDDMNEVPLSTDQRGVARIIDGNGDMTATVDMGAYERGVSVTDTFPVTLGKLVLEIPDPMNPLNPPVMVTVHPTGPTQVVREYLGPNVGDALGSGGGREMILTELVSLNLTGIDPLLGMFQVQLNPGRPSLGQVIERTNTTPGTLDLPPHGMGLADSFFDVFVEIDVPAFGLMLHNNSPIHIAAQLSQLPPAPGETFVGNMPVQLFDDMDQPTPFTLVQVCHTPVPVTAAFDFGDAPDPRTATAGKYPTLDANLGAKHRLGSGLLLGATVDGEADGQPNATATGDDTVGGTDDEDGVILPATLIAGLNAVADVTASAPGLLDAWIDYNSDGDWDDDGERITPAAGRPVVVGANAVAFVVPLSATDGGTFARFRLSSAGGLTPRDEASDGEVEDYAVEIDVLAAGSCQLVADPAVPIGTALVCIGTAKNDRITFEVGDAPGEVDTDINGHDVGQFVPTTRLVAFGLGGKDKISVAAKLPYPAVLFGGEGNDDLSGGSRDDKLFGEGGNDKLKSGLGNDVLVGGDGDDALTGQGDRDVLIGGDGKDTLKGGKSNALLIGSSTDHDADLIALMAISAEWALGDPIADRVARLTGATPGGLNGPYLLKHDAVPPGPGTVHDDGDADKLKGSGAIDWFFAFDFDSLTLTTGDLTNHP